MVDIQKSSKSSTIEERSISALDATGSIMNPTNRNEDTEFGALVAVRVFTPITRLAYSTEG